MKRYVPQSFSTGLFIVVVLGIGLALSLFMLISPTQAGQTGLNPPIDVEATAQAIQARHRQTQLEATRQAQQAAWETEITDLEQTLTASRQEAQARISQLEAQLITINSLPLRPRSNRLRLR
jgi:hypothetical protein